MTSMLFDDTFDTVGHMGLFQIFIFFLVWLPGLYTGQQNIAMNFLGGDHDHWCKVDRLSNYSFGCQKYVAIPSDDSRDTGYSRCEQFDIEYDTLTEDELKGWNRTIDSEPNGKEECSQWVYDQSMFISTVSSEWDLVCGKRNLVQLVSSLFLLGMLFGAVTTGALSDKLGRKKTIIICSALHLVFGVTAAVAPWYWLFVVFRFFTAFFGHGSMLTGFVIMMEVTGPKYRGTVGALFHIAFSCGFMLLPGIAYNVRDFRLLQLALAIPILVSMGYIWLIPESPRWLMVNHRHEEAVQVLNRIADVNNRPRLPDDIKFADEEVQKGSYADLFRYPALRKEILILYYYWFVVNLIFYGLSLNTGTLSGSLFLNTFYSGLVEVPGVFGMFFVSNYLGRKHGVTGSMFATGIFLLACIPLLDKPDLAWLNTTFTMIGKAAAKMAFSCIYLTTAELFPTPVRHLAVGSSSMMARVSGLLAPFMGEPMIEIWAPLPQVIFGVFAVSSATLTFFLPETLGKPLPDTFEEAIALSKGKHEVEVDLNSKPDVQDSKPDVQESMPDVQDTSPKAHEAGVTTTESHENGTVPNGTSNGYVTSAFDTGHENQGFDLDAETTQL